MTKRITSYAIIMALFGAAAWAGAPTEQLKGTLSQLIVVLNDPSLKEQGKETQRTEALHQVLSKRLDETTIARKTLGRYWDNITEDERKEFIPLYVSLLERIYFERIDAELEKSGKFSSEDIHYTKEQIKKNAAQVSTEIVTGDGESVPVIFRLRKVEDTWLVIDMMIEGVIITKNYRAQFYEILARQPMSALIEKLRDKQVQ